tara:strand:+ start:275 stop:697 length:423 start_codon:yes stop_codon:yes gene_type:complete
MEQRLIDSVIAQLNCEDDELGETMTDITSNGADAGFSGFTYYRETCQFARDNMGLIYMHARVQAADFGEDSPLVMIAGFKCLHDVTARMVGKVICNVLGSDDSDGIPEYVETSILNALAWYALEEVAHHWDWDSDKRAAA